MSGKRVNLDEARKARAEKRGEPPVVELGGRDFTLPHAIPAAVLVGMSRARRGDIDGFEDALTSLFGDEVAEAVALGLELPDLEVIIEQAYGEDDGPGEASGSTTSP